MSEQINNLKNILNQISAISNKYKEMAKLTGENYNIFKILDVATKEVKTHSAFIADLLNPNGVHQQGSIFLKLFIEQLSSKTDISFNANELEIAKTQVERHIGRINSKYTEGGNIDIIVETTNKAIIIENKIYAEDQRNQLLRYYNYAVKRYNDFTLIYLTLYGHSPSNYSLGTSKTEKSDIKYINISYSNDIIQWLEKCHKETANKPIIRETITQYINLIKQLTGQAMSNKMNEEIKEIILNNNSEVKLLVDSYNNYNNYRKNKFDDISHLLNKYNYESDSVNITKQGPFNYEDVRVYKYGLSYNSQTIWVQLIKKEFNFYFHYYHSKETNIDIIELVNLYNLSFEENISIEKNEEEIKDLFLEQVDKVAKAIKELN